MDLLKRVVLCNLEFFSSVLFDNLKTVGKNV